MNRNDIDKIIQQQQSQTQMPFEKNGFDYFLFGCRLIFNPGIKRYVFLPLLANIIIMSALFYWFFSSLSGIVDFGLLFVPSWLQWLSYIITFIIILTMAIFFCYFFSTVANIIAAPFNGLLAEQVEAQLTGSPAPNVTWVGLLKDTPRILYREMQKLVNYILWAIPIFLTSFIPVFGQFATPIIWFLFTAWRINIQYADYAFDNHKIAFHHMRQLLKQHKVDNLTFGILVSLFTMIPIFNLIIMPVAVCGSTAMWVARYRHQALYSSVAS